ncbi:translation machinery-associated protein 16 [Sphaerosporella brunnea]|uniref:Translation machinery-associated protein 16 n=1 Tax=Sphaerosporella brunnea TaxID=1250544 RepID=A0A5J5EZ79_9PEZI|nr:translation machinery-associated protein 16 [Sphaerosporella brunnea]
MPKIALRKVEKKIRKKRGAVNNLGDREAARYNRAALREQKLKTASKLRTGLKENEMIRTGYFKVATKDATVALDLAQIRELIERWVHRDDEELARFEAERRPGRPPVAKHLELKNKVEKELDEFRTGFYMPDLQDYENILNLQRWDGKLGSLAQVKFTRVSQEDPPVPVDKMEI